MARNRIGIDAPIERVFEVLRDPFSYPRWVVGTRTVVAADSEWPGVGSRFSYETGRSLLRYRGETRVVQADPPRRLLLKTSLPVGAVDIDIELREQGGRTIVELSETAPASPLRSSIDAALHVRNWQTLARLKALVEETRPGLDPESLHAGRHWLEDDPFAQVIAQAERCYVVVGAKNGPHVTPAAFLSVHGRLWIVISRGSLKARAIAREPRVGVTIRGADGSVVVWGRATVIDPRALWIPRDITERLLAGPAMARYLVANQRRLGGYVLRPASIGELNPLTRILVSISPERAALVRGADVIEQRGAVPIDDDVEARGNVPGRVGEPFDLTDVPESLADLAEAPRVPATLGWNGVSGPVALPARWHGDRDLVSVPAALMRDDEGRAGLCLDLDLSSDLDAQKGMLVRGRGRVVGVQAGYAAISIDADKTTIWEGANVGP